MTNETVTIQQFSDRLNAIWDAKLRANPVENIAIPALGLCGEAAETATEVMMACGRASEHFKKNIRDGKPLHNMELAKELGDVLHYWCRLTKLAGFTPADIMLVNEAKLAERRKTNAAVLDTMRADAAGEIQG